MRVLIIGKFPPIQGGVSAQTYWTAHQLAERGHEVHVVTNSEEIDYGYREFLFGDDRERLARSYAQGSVTLHTTTPLRAWSYIPWAPPYNSQLFGLAVSVMEKHECDLVFGWYFEPYCVVAAQVAAAFGKPLAVRHAGSDIGRLAQHPQLRSAYQWIASRADAIFSTHKILAIVQALEELGFTAAQLRSAKATPLPPVYTKQTDRLDVSEVTSQAQEWYRQVFPAGELAEQVNQLNSKPVETNHPTIGIYGKVGETKGSFDLIRALDKLAAADERFNFLSVAGGDPPRLAQYCQALLSSERLRQRTWLLPLVAPWRIPSFIRRCDITCFLERDFPIAFHGSTIPREILAAGSCLVCSEEMAVKLPFAENLVNGKNYVMVHDPKDSDELASRLRNLLADDAQRHVIAAHGKHLSKFWEDDMSSLGGVAGAIERFARDFGIANDAQP
jgi:glycosyltransferase involved in cell wall biosynthesis